MIGEREDIINETSYGDLTMRTYDIENNIINAFYDGDDIVFVLDKTITEKKPNVLLVINPDGDKKWDEILSGQYGVDLETIRPKQDNKYQKLDIEYSGLNVYENLIQAYTSGLDISESIVQLNILRDSAARHSAMVRLNVANETITKTNATIVKTKETIIRLQERLKTLRSKLSSSKKEIGKVAPKQSASKILRLESQIEATNEKLKRAKKRLESAQRRLEAATVDAELASDLLNQPESEIVVAPKTSSVKIEKPVAKIKEPVFVEEDDDEDDTEFIVDDDDEGITSDIKPLFDTEPDLDEDIAFKPIDFNTTVEQKPIIETEEVKFEEPSFTAPVIEEPEDEPEFEAPVLDTMLPAVEEEPEVPVVQEQKPVLDTFKPISNIDNFTTMDDAPMLNDENPTTENNISGYDAPIPNIQLKPIEDKEPEIVRPVEDVIQPVPPVAPVAESQPVPPYQTQQELPDYKSVAQKEHSKPTFIYYILLFILIALSVVTLWLYQKNMGTNSTGPMLVAETTEEATAPAAEEEPVAAPAVVEEVKVAEPEIADDEVFLDDKPAEEPAPVVPEPVLEPAATEEETPESVVEPEPVVEEPAVEETAPIIAGDVSANVMSLPNEEEMDEEPIAEPEPVTATEEEILASKPVFETGSKHDEMFVQEEDTEEPVSDIEEPVAEDIITPANQEDVIVDEEENAFQAELEYEE